MSETNPNLDGALQGVDEHKRATLKRLVGTGAFVTPAVVSFTMADLSIDAFMHVVAAANLPTTTTTTTTTTTGAPGTTTTTTAAPGTTTTTTTVPPGHPAKS